MGLYKVWEGEGRKDSTEGVSTGEKELIYFLKKNSGLYAIFWKTSPLCLLPNFRGGFGGDKGKERVFLK